LRSLLPEDRAGIGWAALRPARGKFDVANWGRTKPVTGRKEKRHKATIEQARARKLDSGLLRLVMYYLGFVRGDSVQIEQQLSWGSGKPGAEDPLLSAQSDTEAYYG